MTSILEILHPDFLLRDALVGSVLIGVICPLVGVYFVLRRMIFLGIALPQVSAAGIAFSFFIYRLLAGSHEHGEIAERALALSGSLIFTLAALLILSLLESRTRTFIEGNIGATYAIAASLTILFLAADPQGEAEMVNILKGDILAATAQSLILQAVVFFLAGGLLLLFRRQLLLVSFDRDLAAVFGMSVKAWDILLYFIIGATISIGVMSAGPVVVFGFLILPPLTARIFSTKMTTFILASAGIGAVCAFFGFYAAFTLDLPLGPTQIALASILLVVCSLLQSLKANYLSVRQ